MTANISSAVSPGKLILLGEHAVVYGKPAVAIAIDRSFKCTVEKSNRMTLNGNPISLDYHPHVKTILKTHGIESLALTTESTIPATSGLGSSAALSSSLSAAVRKLAGEKIDKEEIANEAFNAEYVAQGRASPLDTSCCTNGKGISLNCPDNMGEHLWTISKESNTWNISEIHVPEMTFVIGYTGIKAPTGPLVEKVRRYRARNTFAADIINEIGDVTLEGMKAIDKNDVEQLGRIMTKDHKLLSILGVSCNELNKLVNASLDYSYGAKLTGSGGGGSMVALTDKPKEVCDTIRLHGGEPFVVKTNVEGVHVI